MPHWPARYYATPDGSRRFRKFKVVKSETRPEREGGRLVITYSVASRHFTWQRALRAARSLNIQEGFAA